MERSKTLICLLFVSFFIFLIKGYGQEVKPIFSEVKPEYSNLYFKNLVEETPDFNYYIFMHLYMGAGVAAGDFNNDKLPDIFFTSNTGDNKLFLNKGRLQFEDITDKAQIKGNDGFYTGVTTVDINNDGWLDIYVCRSGPETDPSQNNLFFINNGDLTFTESSVQMGLAEGNSHSIQSNFFDYDNDGDLDVYIVNTPVEFKLANEIIDLEKIRTDKSLKKYGGADKLFRNNGDLTFTDVSESSGILPDLFFGLTVAVADFNDDGYQDIFVANDFAGPDFLYMNNGDGTFVDKAAKFFQHTSNYSMGADVADINNDGFQDLFVLDMLPEDYKRSKTSMTMMPRDVMYNMVQSGYQWQYMHNVLQINNGVFSSDKPLFKDLSYFSGIENTDWSWSCLIADFDLDGLNDIHVTNGILRDVTNVDSRIKEKEYVAKLKSDPNAVVGFDQLKKARELYPSVKLANYLFRNNGDLTFENVSTTGNVGLPSFSNGSAYADFDNDGDLDLVCNNVNDNAFLFENLSSNKGVHYLKIRMDGHSDNRFGFGAKVKLFADDKAQLKELHTTRGYFSASEPILHFGLGKTKRIKKIEVKWPDGKIQVLNNIKADQELVLQYKDAVFPVSKTFDRKSIFKLDIELLDSQFVHSDISYDDFKDQLLLPHKLSNEGPCMSVGDLNNDGLDDFFIGGAAWFSGAVYFQKKHGNFIQTEQPTFELDKMSEDISSLVFDANGDGFMDLYVVSGSYEMDNDSESLYDRLYLNNGQGQFTKSDQLPLLKSYGSCVTAIDFDKDGDMDVFVGARTEKGKYPFTATSYVLVNDKGTFKILNGPAVNEIENLGMVTDAVASDFDNDGDDDLIIVGEWMPITFLENDNGVFRNRTKEYGFDRTSGWWNTIVKADIDLDGDLDYIAGNLGLNYKFHASKEKPFHIYGSDFDKTGTVDIVLAKDIDNVLFPVRGKMCSTEQMPFIGDKFPSFAGFAEANIIDIYGSSNLDEALHLEVQEFRSVIIRNNSDGKFTLESLPLEAQYAPINGIVCHDFDSDGYQDLLLAGNKFEAEVETSRADAGTGLLLKGNKDGVFETVTSRESGFFVPGNIKAVEKVVTETGVVVLAGENNGPLLIFK